MPKMIKIPGSANLQESSNQPISDNRHTTPPKIKTTPQKRYLYGLWIFTWITSATRVGQANQEHPDNNERDRPG